MKIRFFEEQKQKQNIKNEPKRLPALPETLAVYRAGRKGYIDMRAAVSVLMPVAREIETAHAENETLPSLRPETINISERSFSLGSGAYIYEGTIFPGFSAPEVYSGVTNGIPTDIYSFTAILFFLLTGQVPENAYNRMKREQPLFSDDLYDELKNAVSIYVPDIKIEEDPFEPEIEQVQTIPIIPDDLIDPAFVRILEKGLAVDAAERFESISELIAELSPYNTKSSIVYPVLMSVDNEDVYKNLIITKLAPREKKQKEPILLDEISEPVGDMKHSVAGGKPSEKPRLGFLKKILPPKQPAKPVPEAPESLYPRTNIDNGLYTRSQSGDAVFYGYTQPQPEYPQPEYPQPEYPQPEYPQPEYPQPEYPQPEYSQPECLQPEYPNIELKQIESSEADEVFDSAVPVDRPSSGKEDREEYEIAGIDKTYNEEFISYPTEEYERISIIEPSAKEEDAQENSAAGYDTVEVLTEYSVGVQKLPSVDETLPAPEPEEESGQTRQQHKDAIKALLEEISAKKAEGELVEISEERVLEVWPETPGNEEDAGVLSWEYADAADEFEPDEPAADEEIPVLKEETEDEPIEPERDIPEVEVVEAEPVDRQAELEDTGEAGELPDGVQSDTGADEYGISVPEEYTEPAAEETEGTEETLDSDSSVIEILEELLKSEIVPVEYNEESLVPEQENGNKSEEPADSDKFEALGDDLTPDTAETDIDNTTVGLEGIQAVNGLLEPEGSFEPESTSPEEPDETETQVMPAGLQIESRPFVSLVFPGIFGSKPVVAEKSGGLSKKDAPSGEKVERIAEINERSEEGLQPAADEPDKLGQIVQNAEIPSVPGDMGTPVKFSTILEETLESRFVSVHDNSAELPEEAAADEVGITEHSVLDDPLSTDPEDTLPKVPVTASEQAAAAHKPINLVRLWEKIEKMRREDEEREEEPLE